MTNENQIIMNKVSLYGKVESPLVYSHTLYGEVFFEFIISVSRLSGQIDMIPVTVGERLLANKMITLGDMVFINGQLRSYNKIENNRSKLKLTVFAKNFLDEETPCSNPNSVELIGYLCKEPVYRNTPLNREICDLIIAVNREFNKSDYIPAIVWGRNARFCRSLNIGMEIHAVGRIQSRQYLKKFSETESKTLIAYEFSISKLEVINHTFLPNELSSGW